MIPINDTLLCGYLFGIVDDIELPASTADQRKRVTEIIFFLLIWSLKFNLFNIGLSNFKNTKLGICFVLFL